MAVRRPRREGASDGRPDLIEAPDGLSFAAERFHYEIIPGRPQLAGHGPRSQSRQNRSGNFAVSRDVQIDTVRFKTFLTAGMLGTVLCNAVPNPSVESDTYTRSIREFGGNRVNPMAYSDTTAGFQSYLTDCGVKTVSARELILPNHPDVAARLGFHEFRPQRSWWPRGAALALLTQLIEAQTNSPVRVRNWWRPTAYNSDPAVGGAKAGDHPTASAVDLDYRTISERMRAELFLRALEKRCPWLQLSLGLGALTTHVGIGSPNGHREWHYEGWRPPAAKRT